ncbi:MAG: hypothetical protein AAF678_00045 [Pseudomonadota bacterium]
MTLTAFLNAFDALPQGAFYGQAFGRRYSVVRRVAGARQSLVAEELGGSDYISFNLYRLSSGPRLKPCEMPSTKVIDFTLAFVAEDLAPAGQ